MKTRMYHKDGDVRILLSETLAGTYKVHLLQPDHEIEFCHTVDFKTAVRRYNQAVTDENDAYLQ